jgi:hypothetical protein
MKSENKRWLLVAVSAVVALCLNSFGSAANAQGSVNVKKGQLQQTGWYKSNMQVQIVDDGPVVHDYRTAPANDPGFQIPVGPAGANNGRIPEGGIPLGDAGGPRMPRIERNTLPQSGFGSSNIPARGMGPATALPGTKMGGLGNQGAQQKTSTGVAARPIGRPQTVSQVASPASYGGSGGGQGVNYGGGGSSSTSLGVRAKLLGH